jgi:hypothetical protein
LFRIVSLKISSLPTLTLKSSNNIFISYQGNWANTCPNSVIIHVENVPHPVVDITWSISAYL